MRSLLQEMKERFHEIEAASCEDCNRPKDKCICEVEEETVEEQNVTGALDGGAGPPKTPFAFATKTNKKTAEQLGYKLVQEAMDRKYEKIIESYTAYATGDAKITPEGKIKNTIKEVARQLQEIEKTVHYAARLKNETNIARAGYGPAVDKALNSISQRLIKISERVRALGE
jgi:hypothetical protein